MLWRTKPPRSALLPRERVDEGPRVTVRPMPDEMPAPEPARVDDLLRARAWARLKQEGSIHGMACQALHLAHFVKPMPGSEETYRQLVAVLADLREVTPGAVPPIVEAASRQMREET